MYVSYLTDGLNALQTHQQNLIKTFGTIKTIHSEGLYVDVQLDESIQGATILQKIPVIHHPYFNLPIRVGDKVFLTNVNHLLNEYFTTGTFTKYVPSDSYIAIPVTLQQKFTWTNHFHYKNPEGTFELVINDKERTIKAETIDEKKSLKSTTQDYADSVKIEAKQKYELKANAIKSEAQTGYEIATNTLKIEAKTTGEIVANTSLRLEAAQVTCGSKAVTLGACLSELITIMESAMTMEMPGPAPHMHKTFGLADAPKLAALKTKIMGVFK